MAKVAGSGEENVALETLPVAPPPPVTKTMQAVLEKSTGFSAVVSYTDNGFEPAQTVIKRGDTVRFTNNSTGKMWVTAAANGGSVYPGSSESCGQSAFDTCTPLAPNEIWEFTFEKAGTWSYQNNVDAQFAGTIRVQ